MSTIERPSLDQRAIKESFQNARRSMRMHEFVSRILPRSHARVLDLGGTPSIWQHVDVPLRITVLNLDAECLRPAKIGRHEIEFVRGDACDVSRFDDREFDLVFSNSCIEHVGPLAKQAAFAREVRRLGWAYWVQTPCRWFPIEAHSNKLFWWFYPERVRRRLIEHWRPQVPGWTEMLEGTRVLRLAQFRSLFPDGHLYVEVAYGFPKSYTLYRPDPRP